MEQGTGLASKTRKRKGGCLMPTWEELQAQMREEALTNPADRNQRIAEAVQGGQLTAQGERQPELTDEEVARIWEPAQQELTDVEAAERMTPRPEEQFGGIVKRMAENYQTSPQYRQLLDQELQQISAQIAQLTQRRNMIEMARRGQG
jgi:hypothetical protein